jgi:hypothetical protein
MKGYLLLALTCLSITLEAQDSAKKRSWSFGGYIKDMEWVRFEKESAGAAATNLLHNRINIKWNPSVKWTADVEIRNRFYGGDDVHSLPAFQQQLRNPNELINLTAKWFTTGNALLHTNIERLWIDYKTTKWNIRTGRQRINWGITNTWNPNDIFNSYNFLDFDYEERPGTDAIKAAYSINDLSNVELSIAGTDHQSIIAAKYFTNYHNYDLQWNAGLYLGSFTAGFAWAGNIKQAGFKGEAQFYIDRQKNLSHLVGVLEGDYIFKNGWYVSSAFMYNQKGIYRPVTDTTKFVSQPSPQSLMPTKWNLLANVSKEFTPIFTGTMTVVFAPGANLFIFFPTLHYNLKTNWDLDLTWQSFMASSVTLSHTGFLRLRWSF